MAETTNPKAEAVSVQTEHNPGTGQTPAPAADPSPEQQYRLRAALISAMRAAADAELDELLIELYTDPPGGPGLATDAIGEIVGLSKSRTHAILAGLAAQGRITMRPGGRRKTAPSTPGSEQQEEAR